MLLAAAAGVLTAGCASGTVPVGSGSHPPPAGGTAASAPQASATDTSTGAPPPGGTTASSPERRRRPGGSLVLTADGDGRTVSVQLGEQVVVRLRGGWTPPRAVATRIVTAPLQPLRTDASTGYPQPAAAQFTAVRTGTTTITASTDAACFHTTPRCLMPQRQFTVAVQVRPRSGTGGGPLPKPPPS